MARSAVLAGGAATVVVAMAVVGAVSTAHAIALKDSSGVPAGRPLVVPFTGSTVEESPLPRVSPRAPEVVPAPEPMDIGASRAGSVTPTRSVLQPVTGAVPNPATGSAPDPDTGTVPEDVTGTVRERVKDAMSGIAEETSIDRALVAERRDHGLGLSASGVPDLGRQPSPQTPAKAGSPSGHGSPKSWSGSKKERSPVVSDRRD